MATTIDDLKELRDQILLKLHLAGMDAKQQWDELEPKLIDLEHRLERGGDKIGKATGKLIEDLGNALHRFRDRIEKT